MFHLAAIVVEIPQMGTTAPARRHVFGVIAAECFGHAPPAVALFAFDFHIGSFSRCPDFIQIERSLAVSRAAMHVFQPGEIIQVTVWAGHHEAGGEGRRWRALGSAVMDVSCLVWPIGDNLPFEQAGADRRKQPATRAYQPSRE